LTAFIDTSALIALLDADDPAHGACRESWRHAVTEAEGLVTTDYVVLETIAVTQRRWGFAAVRTIVSEFLPLIEILPVSTEIRATALDALLAASRRRLSLVDCVSFTVMRRRGIHEYLGLDRHFDEQGFERYAPAE
jgi:predicted nucleic acid-binding protein